MNTNYVLFDGNDYGIAVEYVSAVGKQFIRYNKAIRLFKSLELAKVICRAMVEGCQCNYYISARGKLIPLSDCLVKNNEYHYIYIHHMHLYYIHDNEIYIFLHAHYKDNFYHHN